MADSEEKGTDFYRQHGLNPSAPWFSFASTYLAFLAQSGALEPRHYPAARALGIIDGHAISSQETDSEVVEQAPADAYVGYCRMEHSYGYSGEAVIVATGKGDLVRKLLRFRDHNLGWRLGKVKDGAISGGDAILGLWHENYPGRDKDIIEGLESVFAREEGIVRVKWSGDLNQDILTRMRSHCLYDRDLTIFKKSIRK